VCSVALPFEELHGPAGRLAGPAAVIVVEPRIPIGRALREDMMGGPEHRLGHRHDRLLCACGGA